MLLKKKHNKLLLEYNQLNEEKNRIRDNLKSAETCDDIDKKKN